MVEVTLCEYCEEIDSLIDQGAFDAAISHCQHILKIHPKYLKVYSLLGKAALEKGDLEAAADLFSRVLSMDPEDFVARVGMSIASDKDGSLDQAIWHMERAFELAPDNQAIVGELSRLYGRRDGVEPKKVQLTQGALARLHARGSLYTQAINEQRRLLQTEPERVDLQVALAETLWRADRRIEAAEVSLTILEKLPYCLKANLILGEIWSSSGREIEGTAHLERAQMIDPENQVSQDHFGERSLLPRTEVRVGRMEYVSPPALAEQEPDWLQTLIEEGGSTTATDEAVPDWLQAVAASAVVKAMSPEEDAAPESEQVPDWLQDVAATADVDAEELVLAPETLSPSEGEMPDWLAQLTTEPQAAADELIAPQDFPEGIEETPPAVAEEGAPGPDEVADWLDAMVSDEEKIGEMGPGQAELSAAEQAVAEPDDGPDWLAEIGPAAAGLAAAGLAAAGLAAATEDESEPTEAELLGAEEAELAPGEIPDWLAEMAPTDVGAPTGVDASADARLDEVELTKEVELAPGEIPDWLAEMAPTDVGAPTDVDAPTEEGARAEPEPSKVPDWLTEAEPGAAEETAAEPGDGPDWLAEIEPTAAGIGIAGLAAAGLAAATEDESEPIEAEDSELAPGEIPDWLAEMASTDEGAPAEVKLDKVGLPEETELEPGEIPDWLAEMAPTDVGAPAEALPIEAEVERGEIPDWLAEMAPAEVDALAGPVFAEVEPDEAVVSGDELAVEELEAAPPPLVAAETPDWLEELVITAGATIEEEAPPADQTVEPEEEALPEWLAELEKTPDALDLGEGAAAIEVEDLGTLKGAPPAFAQEEEEEALDAETELMARMEEMSPEEAFAAWEAMLAESEEELVEESAAAPEEAEIALDAEAELMARMEELPPEEAFAAWEAALAESELEEAAPEPAALQAESPVPSGPVVIEEPDKETLVYPEGAGGEITDAEAELMAQMEEMSPEEAFAAWEAMLSESEELEPEDTAPTPEDVAVPSEEVGEAVLDAETELMARLEEMSPEEAFAAWETMLAEGEALVPEEVAPTPEEAVVPFEEEEEARDADAELVARLEEMSPEEAFAAWETTLAESDDQLLEEEAPSVEVVAEEEEAWMALVEDEPVEATAPIAVEETLPTEVQADLPAEEVEQKLPGTPTTDLDQAWMILAEDESLEEIPAHSISEEESIVAGIEAVERAEEEEPEIEIPPWATAEAVETIEKVPLIAEQEIRMGPDLVLLTEEEEAEIKLPQEPELAAPVDIGEPIPDMKQPAEEEAAVFATAEAVVPTDLEDEAEAVEQPAWVAMEEAPISEALIEDAPRVEEKVTEPDSDQARLELARELWTAGQKADARAEYERLLRSTMRGEVTTDLEKLVSDESADEPTLRLLGDAYMKEDRLQEALEAYRRALSSL